MSELEFIILIFWFTAYYFIERCLRAVLNAYLPSFYYKIRASRKDLVFFGIGMGLLISAFSTPFCAYGARNAWTSWRNSSIDDHSSWALDQYSKVCVASRAILWVSELNRLDMYGLYVVHHAGSIISLLSFLYFQWPVVIFITLYSGLVSEIPGDMVWMLSSYLDAVEQAPQALARLKHYLVRFNVLQYTLIRGVTITSVFWMALTNSPGVQDRSILEQTYGYTLLGLYALFCVNYILRQYNNIKNAAATSGPSLLASSETGKETRQTTPHFSQTPVRLEHKSPRHLQIRFGTHPPILIVPYGLFMGLGFASVVFISLAIGAPSEQGRNQLSFALNLTLVSAVFGARLFSIIMEDGFARLVAQPLRTLLRPGFWLHGGIFGAMVGALLSYRLGHVEKFSMFAGSLAVGFPLYEAFSRIGCHTYGCCYGHAARSPTSDSVIPSQVLWRIFPYPSVQYSHPTHYAATRINPKLLHVPLVPIQLISATLFILLFLGISLPLSHFTRAEVAGSLTLIFHVAIRLITETHRADYRGEKHLRLSATGRMALVQAIGATLWFVYTLVLTEAEMSSPVPTLSWGSLQRWCSLGEHTWLATALGIIVYGVHVGEIGSWIGGGKETANTSSLQERESTRLQNDSID